MATQKIVELLNALMVGTEKRQVFWEDLPDEDMFRTHVGGGLIRIGRTEDKKGYALWLMGHGGAIVAEASFLPSEPGFQLSEEVYSSARLAARGGNELLDNIIRQLNPQAAVAK
jgi:hypothetical protein